MSKIWSSASPSQVYGSDKLHWHFSCGFNFRHSLKLPFAAVLSVSKGLNNKKQYIQMKNEEKTNLLLVKCGVLGPLLFLIYINDLQFISDVFHVCWWHQLYSHKDINALFLKVNSELHKINQWFISNKLSLNIKKQQNIHFSINKVNRMIFPSDFLIFSLNLKWITMKLSGQNQFNFLVLY